jgi:phospholipase/lecithinase/hemolysin
MRQFHGFLLALTAGLVLASSAWAGPVFNDIYAFGDSLTDTGNLFLATQLQHSQNSQVPVTPSPSDYWDGRFTNGTVWVEQLATKLGFAPPTPSLAGGADYAFGGATTGPQFAMVPVPNIIAQVNNFTSVPGHLLTSNDLIVVWGGANDIINGQTIMSVSVANLKTAITNLAAAGGKEFLVPNLPLLGNTPFGSANQAGLNFLSQQFNQDLKSMLESLSASLGIQIFELNTAKILAAIESNPGVYGLSNVASPAHVLGTPLAHGFNGNGYLFWDGFHPTTGADQILAASAYDNVTQSPEPSTLVLVLSAGMGMAACGWRRRKGETKIVVKRSSRKALSPGSEAGYGADSSFAVICSQLARYCRKAGFSSALLASQLCARCVSTFSSSRVSSPTITRVRRKTK